MPRAKVTVEFNERFFDEALNSTGVRTAIDLAAERAAAEAKATAPVDSGTYRDSIHVEHEQGEHRQVALVVADAPHALWVEVNTGNLAKAIRKAKI